MSAGPTPGSRIRRPLPPVRIRMHTKNLLLVVYAVTVLIAAAPVCRAAGAPTLVASPPPAEYEVTDSKTGRRLATIWGWSEPVAQPSPGVAAVSDTVFAQGTETRVRALFTLNEPPRCVWWEETLRDKHGTVLMTRHMRWRPEVFPLLGRPFPPATYPLQAPIGYVLTRLGLEAREKVSFYTVLGGNLTQVDLWRDGIETVRVPAGTFQCYRIRMRANAKTLFPNLPAFLRPVLSFFIPTYSLWLTVSQPQLFVKFEGQMGPPGSPELRIQLLKLKRPQQ